MATVISNQIPSRFSVIKYVDDIDKDEPVNIGVILQSKNDNKFSIRFANYEKLYRRFGNSRLLKLIIENIIEETTKSKDKDILPKLSEKYGDNLRFTAYRGTVATNLRKQLDSLYTRYISFEHDIQRERIITSPYIRKNIWGYIHEREHVARNKIIEGKRSKFRYDFVFGLNDRIFHSISFDSLESVKKTKLFDWNVMDAIGKNGLVKRNFGAIISEPSEKNPKYQKVKENYKEGKHILESKNYDLVYFDESGKWKKQLQKIYI